MLAIWNEQVMLPPTNPKRSKLMDASGSRRTWSQMATATSSRSACEQIRYQSSRLQGGSPARELRPWLALTSRHQDMDMHLQLQIWNWLTSLEMFNAEISRPRVATGKIQLLFCHVKTASIACTNKKAKCGQKAACEGTHERKVDGCQAKYLILPVATLS